MPNKFHSVTGAAWRSQFDGLRFAPHGHCGEAAHGGTRVIDLTSERRTGADIVDSIRQEQQEHAETIAAFHRVFYGSRQTHGMTFYEGVPVLKSPLDLWVYQEIIWDLKPTLIVETGTAYGGSALYYARQMDRVADVVPGYDARIISVDIEPADTLPNHPRIQYVKGFSSTYDQLVAAVGEIAATHPRVMVVLDSDHSKRHVLAELDAYAPFVTMGQFLVVEDTNINGRPVNVDWRGGPGPGPAVDEWLPQHTAFERAVIAERYLMTFHTWMRRIAYDAR